MTTSDTERRTPCHSPALVGVSARSWVRTVVATTLLLAVLIVSAPPAAADAAGPTDYRTDIVSVRPSTPSIELSMIGGDSFMRLVQLEPVEVLVLGYRGEPYLRFDPDGNVVENRRSPSTWLNQDRFGTDESLPSFVDHEAPPDWRRVADDGSYAWHDHRSHWMNPSRPPGAEPGDQVLEATVPIEVAGLPVTVTVASFLLEDPPWWPAALGVVVALAGGIPAVRSGRLSLVAVVVAAATAALVLGIIAFRSVPAETEPSSLLWLLPALAVVTILAVAALRNRLATTVYLDGLSVVAGSTHAAWALTRFDALTKALIPSDAPASLDRLVIGVALVIGGLAALRGFYGLARPRRLIDPTP